MNPPTAEDFCEWYDYSNGPLLDEDIALSFVGEVGEDVSKKIISTFGGENYNVEYRKFIGNVVSDLYNFECPSRELIELPSKNNVQPTPTNETVTETPPPKPRFSLTKLFPGLKKQ